MDERQQADPIFNIQQITCHNSSEMISRVSSKQFVS